MIKKTKQLACLLLSVGVVQGAQAAVIDGDAEVVQLRTSCMEAGIELDNCFTSTNDLVEWLDIRAPNEHSPLLVRIGPGEFSPLNLTCNGNAYSHITIRGSGRGVSVINGDNFLGFIAGGGCKEISVENITIKGGLSAVAWFGRGNSTWHNVELDGGMYGWYDAISTTGHTCSNPGRHNIFSSTIMSNNSASTHGAFSTFRNACGKVWLFGSEITANIASTSNASGTVRAISSIGPKNELHVYGGNVRVINDSTDPALSTVIVTATDDAHVHIHGTGIDGIAASGGPVIALSASNDGMIHANSSAYALSVGEGGTITRVDDAAGSGHIHAPYLWEGHAEPPAIVSVTGADMSVITNTDDGQPHLVIYSSNCASKWYNTVTKSCH